jgi:putative selenate reductase
MSDRMIPQPFPVLLRWALGELAHGQSIFGIPRALFYIPRADSPTACEVFGQHLATPIGPAAGPHTQLAQNIVCAWLSGARFIELKTVQVMDQLSIPRPCIDAADEGYNVEWSQELRLEQSAGEYVTAWALVHVLHHALGFATPVGTVFNMSVGYNLEGIQSVPLTRFMDRLADASEDIAQVRDTLRREFPQLAEVEIPPKITNNVTLSTMHGCPPDEIERICHYLLEERGLHTTVKLNPTLLGKETMLEILHQRLGFTEIAIPDCVFEHDLDYGRAVELIRRLRDVAAARGRTFGVKLSNTLAMANRRGVLPGDEVYMSGRALYPLTINLFRKLAQEFDGGLPISYSAGADALNLPGILAAGARPVTVVTDLLKPGGYSRLAQYLERLEQEMRSRGAASLDDLARDRLASLEREAARAVEEPRYYKSYHPYGLPKVASGLGLFDCIAAPCVEACPACQDVPEYAWLIAQGDYERALEVILARNPLPGVTGYVCTHVCQERCTRNNYDQPVAIRALKRFAFEKARETRFLRKNRVSGQKVAVVGSGPSGLAAAYYLALSGVAVTVFESRGQPGGMLALAPAFRLPEAVVREDIARIQALGVEIKLSHPVIAPPESLLAQGFDAVYVASGAQRSARLGIEGEDGADVYPALDFLERVSRGERVELGRRVLVIGGGNSAMDSARTARRLVDGPVTLVYRRTRAEMPATEEELAGLLAEGVRLKELASPVRIILREGRVAALECVRNRLGEPGADGRRRFAPIRGSEFQIAADVVIVAIGQQPDVAFLDGSTITLRRDGSIATDSATGRASAARVYAGGDAVRGPDTIIAACADGRRAAQAICRELGVGFAGPQVTVPALSPDDVLRVRAARARLEAQRHPALLPPEQRSGFDVVEATLAEEAARAEAARCLQCAALCDKCVEVCPNRANLTYLVAPVNLVLPRLACRDGALAVVGEEVFCIEQTRQIVHIDDLCNECGNCATFCVHEGRPYRDKPRLFLDVDEFECESDNAFHVVKDSRLQIRRREGGVESRLWLDGDRATFESDVLRLEIALPAFRVERMELKRAFEGEFSVAHVAEMWVILGGVSAWLPFLPWREDVG